jgi:hypothetical protein
MEHYQNVLRGLELILFLIPLLGVVLVVTVVKIHRARENHLERNSGKGPR